MSMNDRETFRKGTDQPLVNNKEELVHIVEALEKDNLVMYAAEDNQIILMWERKLMLINSIQKYLKNDKLD